MRSCEECGEFLLPEGSARKWHRFVGLMSGDFRSKLDIPPAFVHHISGRKCNDVTLNSHICHSWHVKIKENENAVFLEDGWPEFVEYHSVEAGDFLVFEYNTHMGFYVKVFARNGFEKVTAGHLKKIRPQKGEEKMVKGKQVVEVEMVEGKPSKYCSFGAHILELSNVRKCDHQEIYGLVKPRILNACYISKRRPVTVGERRNALVAAGSLVLSRPHFKVVLRATSVYRRFNLTIPRKFARKWQLENGSDITLRSSDGQAYVVRLNRTSDRCRLIGGWGYFSLGHNLEEGDVCIFELTDDICEMNVHIFRVVERITPLVLEGR